MTKKFPHQLIDDGGFTENVLLKGVLPPDPSPSFDGIQGTAWVSDDLPVTQGGLSPSPISLDWQSIALPANAQKSTPVNVEPASVQIPLAQKRFEKKVEKTAAPVSQAEQQLSVDEKQDTSSPSFLDSLLSQYNKNSALPDNELANLQKQRSERQTLLDLIDAGTMFTSGMSKANYDRNNLAKFYERADQDIQDLQARRKSEKEKKEEQKNEIKFAQDLEQYDLSKQKSLMQINDDKAIRDPKSEISNMSKNSIANMLSRIGRSDQAKKIMDSNLSHKQLEDIYGQMNMQNYISMYEAQQNRLALEKERAAAKLEQKDDKIAQAQKDKLDKYIQHTREKVKTEADSIQKGRQELTMLESALRNPSAVKDTAALYSMVKSFDPESVVREGEVALAMQGTGYWDAANVLFSRLKKGDTRVLTDQYLKQIKDYAGEVQKIRDMNYRKNMDSRLAFAKDRLGLQSGEEQYVDPLFGEKPAKTITKKQYSPSLDRTRITYSDGTQEELNGRR